MPTPFITYPGGIRLTVSLTGYLDAYCSLSDCIWREQGEVGIDCLMTGKHDQLVCHLLVLATYYRGSTLQFRFLRLPLSV